MAVILTSAQIKEIFEIRSSGTLSKWKNLGAKIALVSRNAWDLKKFLAWYRDNILGIDDTADDELRAARLRYWNAKASEKELHVSQVRGDLMSKSEIAEQWTARLISVTSGLENLAFRLPPVCQGKSRSEMSEAIRREVRTLREAYVTRGHYSPSPTACLKCKKIFRPKAKK